MKFLPLPFTPPPPNDQFTHEIMPALVGIPDVFCFALKMLQNENLQIPSSLDRFNYISEGLNSGKFFRFGCPCLNFF